MIRTLALIAALALFIAAPARASFPYSPSADAVCGTWHTNIICLDVVVMSGFTTNAILAFFQKQPDGSWDWLGNAPINGVQPSGTWAFKAQMWNLCIGCGIIPYKAPDGTVYQGQALDLMNQFTSQLVTGWIAPGNAFLDALWASVSGTPPVAGPPFTDPVAGAQWLQAQLSAYMLNTAGHVAPK